MEKHKRVLKPFIEKHGFTGEIYEMAARGMIISPFFVVKATTDEYVDSQALISDFDGQESLERLKKLIENKGY